MLGASIQHTAKRDWKMLLMNFQKFGFDGRWMRILKEDLHLMMKANILIGCKQTRVSAVSMQGIDL
jgi:hypothetical protein